MKKGNAAEEAGARGVRAWAARMKLEWDALREASRDPALPWLPKFVAALALAYALSPIDLIPDFIPVIGQLDDIVIVPALVALAIRLVPAPIMEGARARVRARRAVLDGAAATAADPGVSGNEERPDVTPRNPR